MTAILVFATFVTFFVVERFASQKASEQVLSTAPLAEAGANEVQSPVSSHEADQPIPRGIDRRQADRRAA